MITSLHSVIGRFNRSSSAGGRWKIIPYSIVLSLCRYISPFEFPIRFLNGVNFRECRFARIRDKPCTSVLILPGTLLNLRCDSSPSIHHTHSIYFCINDLLLLFWDNLSYSDPCIYHWLDCSPLRVLIILGSNWTVRMSRILWVMWEPIAWRWRRRTLWFTIAFNYSFSEFEVK